MWINVPYESSGFVPAEGGSNSDCDWRCQLLESSVTLNGKRTLSKSFRRGWKTKPWLRRLFGRIWPPLTADRGVERWIASLGGSPASLGVLQESAKEPTTPDGSGLRSSGSSKKSTPPGQYLKTSPDLFGAAFIPSSATLPRAGSMRNGTIIPRRMSEHRTDGRESSSSPSEGTAWTTPCSDDTGSRTSRYTQGGTPLSMQGVRWPTPRTITGGGESGERKKELGREESGGGDLQAAASLWGTPTSHERTHTPRQVASGIQLANQVDQWPTPNVPNGGRTMSPEDIANKGMTAKGKRQVGLENVAQLFPTPAARDAKGANSELHCMETGTGRKHMDQLPNFVAHSPLSLPAPQTETPGSASSQSTPSSPPQWPTPRSCSGKGSSGAPRTEYYEKMKLGGLREDPRWPTLIAGDAHLGSTPEAAQRRIQEGKVTLSRVVDGSGQWRTPAGSDGEGGTMEIRPETTGHYKLGDQVGSRARLNPVFVEWMMNWPRGWSDPTRPLASTACASWETGSSRLLRRLLFRFLPTGPAKGSL